MKRTLAFNVYSNQMMLLLPKNHYHFACTYVIFVGPRVPTLPVMMLVWLI